MRLTNQPGVMCARLGFPLRHESSSAHVTPAGIRLVDHLCTPPHEAARPPRPAPRGPRTRRGPLNCLSKSIPGSRQREPRDQAGERRSAVLDRHRGRKLEAGVVDFLRAGSMQAGSVSFGEGQQDTRPVIEQAKAILMAQHGGDPDEAFDLLRRASQRFNVPVRVLAARLVHGVQPPGPQAAQVLHKPPRELRAAPALRALLDEVLDFALTMLHAERGNVQLADPATGALRIAAQRGFGPEFVEYFATVTDDGSACGRAAQQHAQVVITDVTTDPGFAPHREIALASGFRAVQSTPLVNRAGQLIGMLSTHYPRPTTPPRRDLQIASRFGAQAGESLSTLLNGAQPDGFPL
jgi:hypothetical protein